MARRWGIWLLPPISGVVFAALIFAHVQGANGPAYWRWQWQRHPALLTVAVAFLLAATPALAAQFVRERRPDAFRLRVALIGLTALGITAASTALHPGYSSAGWIRTISRDPSSTGYMAAAIELIDFERRHPQINWMHEYDRIMPFFAMHARTKPAGLVAMHYALVRSFGTAGAIKAVWGIATLMAVAGTLSLIAAARSIGGSRAAAEDGATLLALAPSLSLFFPLADVGYPLLTSMAIAGWWNALQNRRFLPATALAAIAIFIASMASYVLLLIGVPMLLMTIGRAVEAGSLSAVLPRIGVAAGVFAGLYALLWALTGYRPLAVWNAAQTSQRWLLARIGRPYPRSIPFDLLDFCLGAGWIPVVLALIWVIRSKGEPKGLRSVVLFGLATPLIVAISGQVQAETARVWIFLLPLIAVPAGLELASWPLRARMIALAALLLVNVALYANLQVILPMF